MLRKYTVFEYSAEFELEYSNYRNQGCRFEFEKKKFCDVGISDVGRQTY